MLSVFMNQNCKCHIDQHFVGDILMHWEGFALNEGEPVFGQRLPVSVHPKLTSTFDFQMTSWLLTYPIATDFRS